MSNSDYDSENLQVLEGLEAVRKRPGMYIGSTSESGLHHLVYELVDNSVDEAMAGHCTKIFVIIRKDGSVTVRDNGRGIPTQIHQKYNMSGVEVALTKLHAGGKFDKDSYKVSGGLHGVGVSVVNALSTLLIAKVRREGKLHVARFEKGITKQSLTVEGETTETGTSITFFPDPEIFTQTVVFDYVTLSSRLRELAFLNKGLFIKIKDERSDKEAEYHYEGGIVEYVKHLNRGKSLLHEPIYLKQERDNMELEVSIQYTTTYNEMVHSFVNNINTKEGGTHLSGFKTALTRTLNNHGEKSKILKDEKLSSEDVREGLTAIISLKIPEPQFEGQTKTKLGNSEVKGVVDSLVSSGLSVFLEETPAVARAILEKALSAAKAREAARKARELIRRKSILESNSLPGKLADCQEKNPEKAEIFIVEGDSAGGSAKQGRSREFQAILPLRGKILNVERSRLHKIIANNEISNIITALGAGIAEEFDISKLRYHKIVIMCDADSDGNHIATLLLTFFFRHLKGIIEQGYLYKAQPPLYQIKKGNSSRYAYTENEKLVVVKEMGDKLNIQRYKGLGEMNPDQLWDTTMDPAQRVLNRITIEDAALADEMFNVLMGDEVEPRRAFIQENATTVVNLDV